MKTDFLYRGFKDPPQKITGDSYKALFGISTRYTRTNNPEKIYRPKPKVKESNKVKVEAFIKQHYKEYGAVPMTLQCMVDNTGISKMTVNKAVLYLEREGRIKVDRNPKNRTRGWVYS